MSGVSSYFHRKVKEFIFSQKILTLSITTYLTSIIHCTFFLVRQWWKPLILVFDREYFRTEIIYFKRNLTFPLAEYFIWNAINKLWRYLSKTLNYISTLLQLTLTHVSLIFWWQTRIIDWFTSLHQSPWSCKYLVRLTWSALRFTGFPLFPRCWLVLAIVSDRRWATFPM